MKRNNLKIIFIHGYTASSKADWYPDISKELDTFGIEYIVPDLPGEDSPIAEEWIRKLYEVILPITQPVVMVGHSLGSRAALLYLEKYPRKIKHLFLIAAFANDTANADRQGYGNFFEHTIDLDKVRKSVSKITVIHSRDDKDIPYAQGVHIANDLHAQLITAESRGHLFDPENALYIFDILQKELRLE